MPPAQDDPSTNPAPGVAPDGGDGAGVPPATPAPTDPGVGAPAPTEEPAEGGDQTPPAAPAV